MSDTNTQADVLHVAADILAAYPDVSPPYITSGGFGDGRHWTDVTWQLQIGADRSHAAQKAAAVELVRTIGGKWDKVELGESFMFTQQRNGVALRISVEREAVCERIVTGTTTVTVPAQEARPERIEEREVVEWRCEPLLAAASDLADALDVAPVGVRA